jgi:DNA-binding Lrp family transcriptional regulator
LLVVMAYKVTTTDRTLIRLLQQNARASFAELSRATGIPESTVRRRVERLQERGVVSFSMSADPAILGYEITAMIGMKVDLPSLDVVGERLRAMPEVTYAAFAMGSLDVILHVVVQSQVELVASSARSPTSPASGRPRRSSCPPSSSPPPPGPSPRRQGDADRRSTSARRRRGLIRAAADVHRRVVVERDLATHAGELEQVVELGQRLLVVRVAGGGRVRRRQEAPPQPLPVEPLREGERRRRVPLRPP